MQPSRPNRNGHPISTAFRFQSWSEVSHAKADGTRPSAIVHDMNAVDHDRRASTPPVPWRSLITRLDRAARYLPVATGSSGSKDVHEFRQLGVVARRRRSAWANHPGKYLTILAENSKPHCCSRRGMHIGLLWRYGQILQTERGSNVRYTNGRRFGSGITGRRRVALRAQARWITLLSHTG
jgi:hypothetical protein